MIKNILDNLRETVPLVHCMTNYVTVNDCANALLAIGASPIMSDDIDDVKDITAICNALDINIGTLNARTIPSMLEAGKISNRLGHCVVLDPVGAGASALRTETARKLIEEIKFTAIRGNISEIKALALGTGAARGVDADALDTVTDANLHETAGFLKKFAKETGAVIAVTGAIDIIADSDNAYAVRNGRPEMSKVCGTGCMLSAILCAFLAAAKETPLEATLAAVCTMGLCGERAFEHLLPHQGNMTYKTNIIDELFNLDGKTLKDGAKYELI